MTVLVAKEPRNRYQSISGIGSSQEDRERADALDKFAAKRVAKLLKALEKDRLMPKSQGQGSVLAYWHVGRALRDIAAREDLLDRAELPLVWIALKKMHLPKQLLYKDRGPYREHLWYCYRLAGHPQELIEKMNWGEWVTIFDSTGINQEERFDVWFQAKLRSEEGRPSREEIRVFAPCINAMLGNIDTQELLDGELHNCYEVAWHLLKKWHHIKREDGSYTVKRREIQSAIKQLLGKLDDVMAGGLMPEEYANEVLELAGTL